MAAEFTTYHVPFVKGLDTRTHPHLLDAPGLTKCQNGEFDEVGIRYRKPFDSIGTSIYPSGTISSVRKLAVVGDELLAFTADTLYSWSPALSKWVSRGTHLAVATTETPVFGNTLDQVFADRAQLSGVVAVAWTETLGATALCYLAAYDATSRATLIAPTAFGSGNTRPRVVALATKILVTWDNGAGVSATTITPSAPTFSTGGATSLSTASGGRYDVVKDPNADQAVFVVRNALGTSYDVGKVTAGLAVTTANKVRTCDGLVAIAPGPAGFLAVIRETFAAGVIRADLLVLATLADATMDTSLGAPTGTTVIPLDQLTAAFRTVTDAGVYRCYVFSNVRTSASSEITEYNWIDTAGATGAIAQFSRTGLASRAFEYNGSVYAWLVFAEANAAGGVGTPAISLGIRGQFQNTCHLFRDDVTIHAKAVWQRAGGDGYYDGHLPGVALVSGTTGYAWAGTRREVITLNGTDQTGYGARTPIDVTFTFDSDSARRTVQLGRTLYVSGGLLLQYDGESLTEVGFEQFPWRIGTSVTAAAGTAAAGAYTYVATLRSENARGERDRSTTAIGVQVTIAALDQVNVETSANRVTRKLGTRPPSVEVWRTKVNPPVGAPFYLVTSRDPSVTGDNGYLSLDTADSVTLTGDVLDDDDLETREQYPENGAVLPRLAPPGATILAATDTRLFLAGIPGEPSRIAYSLQRAEGEVAGFHPALAIDLPQSAGPITALAIMDGTLVAWTATACYAVQGEGLDNTGGGNNYGPPRVLSTDIGATSQDSVVLTPAGLMFFGRKGWYLLTRGWSFDFVGAKVDEFNSDSWIAAQAVESQHQIRLLSASRMLVFDYLAGEWAEWTETGGVALAMWRGGAMLATGSAVKQQATDTTSASYTMDVETGWIKPAGLQGRCRVRWLEIVGELRAAHTRRVRVGVNYVASAYTDDRTISVTGTSGDGVPTRMGPRVQVVEALRVRVTLTPGGSPIDNVTLSGLSLDVALQSGLRRLNPTFNQ